MPCNSMSSAFMPRFATSVRRFRRLLAPSTLALAALILPFFVPVVSSAQTTGHLGYERVYNGALQMTMYNRGKIGRSAITGGAVAYGEGEIIDRAAPLFEGTFIIRDEYGGGDGSEFAGILGYHVSGGTDDPFSTVYGVISNVEPTYSEAPENLGALPGFGISYYAPFSTFSGSPLGTLGIDHRVFASTDPEDQGYIVFEYEVGRYRSGADSRSASGAREGISAGVAFDFDIGGGANAAAWDAERNLIYAYDPSGGQLFGVVGLSGPLTAHSAYFDPGSQAAESAALEAALSSTSIASGTGDVRIVAGYGPFSYTSSFDPPLLRFALVAGDDLAELRSHAERALSVGSTRGGRTFADAAATPAFAIEPSVWSAAMSPSGRLLLIGGSEDGDDLDPTYRYQGVGADVNFFASYTEDMLDYGIGYAKTSSSKVDIAALAADASNNTFVAGSILGTVAMQPGTSSAVSAPGPYGDFFVAKYDASGNYQWGRAIEGPYTEVADDVAADGSGGLWATGSKVLLTRYASDGSQALIWNDGERSIDATGFAVNTDDAGNVVLAFRHTDYTNVNPGGTAQMTANRRGTVIAKYAPSGTLLWASELPILRGGVYSRIDTKDIIIGADGSVTIGGDFQGEVDFDPGSEEAVYASSPSGIFGYSDGGYVARYNADGTLDWVVAYPLSYDETTTPAPTAFAVGPRGETYLLIHVWGDDSSGKAYDLDPGTGVIVASAPPGSGFQSVRHAAVVRLDETGAYDGHTLFEGLSYASGHRGKFFGRGLLMAPDGDLVVYGHIENGVDLDPDPVARQVLAGTYGGVAIRLDTALVAAAGVRSGGVAEVEAGDPPPAPFPELGLEVDFSSLGGNATVTVERVDVPVDASAELPEGHVVAIGKLWRISLLTAEEFAADVCFSLDGLDPLADPAGLVLRKRETGGDPWGAPLTSELRPDAANPTEICALGLTSFSEFVVAADPGALPVELAELTAVTDGGEVVLAWQTLSETNNEGFHVELMREGGWSAEGFVAGAGTTLEAQRYDFRVTGLAPGTHRLRLRQVDYDGAQSYSPEIEVAVGMDTPYLLGAPYPNPASGAASLTLAVQQAQHVRVVAYDMLGRRVALLFDGPLEAEQSRTLRLDASAMGSGLYVLRAEGETFTAARRLTVVR